MRPTLQDIKHDPILSNVSVAYQNEDYIAERILPVIRVDKATGKYFVYDTSKFRIAESLRGMGATTKEVDYGLTQSTPFVIKEYALKELVPDELIDQSPNPLTPAIDATENVTERLLVAKERALAAYMATLTPGATLSGATQWSHADSLPIKNIRDGKQAIHAKIFKSPNVLVLSKPVYDKLIDHTTIVERIKYSALGVATTELLARLLDIDQVIVAGAGYESGREGQASSMTYAWGKHAWLLYVTPRPGIKSISFGYHFEDKPRAVDRWYDNDRKGTFVRCTDRYTREIVSVSCAYFIENAVA